MILTPSMQQTFQNRADAAGDARSWEELEADYVDGTTLRVDGAITVTFNP